MKHFITAKLVELGISHWDTFELFHKGVRDSKDINAYRCSRSGVIVLDNISTNSEQTYRQKTNQEYFPSDRINEDDESRTEMYRNILRDKKWLDFGCGQGGPSLLLKNIAGQAHALELQEGPRNRLNSLGVKCYSCLDDVPDDYYEVMTMFHVYEHLDNPIETIKSCGQKLVKGGRLIVEVPHARDILFNLYSCEDFKAFTLWSEHLILHTRESLATFLKNSGVEVKSISAIQRYPVSNHLYWLSQKTPGGHLTWAFLNSPSLSEAYADVLKSNDMTDTLVAYCEKI